MIRHSLRIGILLMVVCSCLSELAIAQRRKNKDKEEKKISIYDVDTLVHPVPMQRSLFFDKVSKQQRRADASDGKVDGMIYFGEDEAATQVLTKAIMKDVSQIQIMIENLPYADKFTENQTKLGYHRALETLLLQFNNDNKVVPAYYRRLVDNFRNIIIAKYEDRLPDFVKNNVNVYTMANGELLNDADRDMLCQEISKQQPEMMIKKLSSFANKPCADVLIPEAAKIMPGEIFNYASSTNSTLKNAVERSKDPLVKTIVRIVRESKAPLKAKPFLNDIYAGKMTIAEVDRITADPDLFFRELVRLKVETPGEAANAYTDELQYRSSRYFREMNELHEKPEAVRFKCIEPLSAEALYYVIVYGQEEIYTSSFTGAFKRLIEKMKPMKGEEFLDKMHYDKFRTFIRMCAGYNRLDVFLSTFSEDKRQTLMRDFIANLDKGKADDLEDAVDVADAFGSIEDSVLVGFLKNEVKANYEKSYKNKSVKGLKVYALLATLLEGANDTTSNNEEALERSRKLNLPPINFVPYASLVNDSAVVIMQYFFYGDEDGKISYGSFLSNFKGPKWKITTSKYWAEINATSGKPLTIYANLPLAEPEDEEAQNKLNQYMDNKDIHASILVHRGHSYHLPTTLERLTPQTKVVVLGSCGGYHNLATILNNAPDAQIISTKQTGAMAVNEPIIKALNEDLLNGVDINWVNMWKKLGAEFKGKTSEATFRDYVPPHKNLGAIFIKAYRRLDAENDDK